MAGVNSCLRINSGEVAKYCVRGGEVLCGMEVSSR
jgi:hypothetical protein